MIRKYYSSRNKLYKMTLDQLYVKLQNLYVLFRDKDYFKEELQITKYSLPTEAINIANISLSFDPFPIDEWNVEDITEDNIFSFIEFLFDHVSQPVDGKYVNTGYETYYEYLNFDRKAGQNEFKEYANFFLLDYKNGFELNDNGEITNLGEDGIQYILNADIIPFDEKNVDQKVIKGISIWKNRKSTLEDKKYAIQELANVFEWLKKNNDLGKVLNRNDEKDLFSIANNFSIRHHNPSQKSNYDLMIWYSWIFHFYLATYHMVIRSIIRHKNRN